MQAKQKQGHVNTQPGSRLIGQNKKKLFDRKYEQMSKLGMWSSYSEYTVMPFLKL